MGAETTKAFSGGDGSPLVSSVAAGARIASAANVLGPPLNFAFEVTV